MTWSIWSTDWMVNVHRLHEEDHSYQLWAERDQDGLLRECRPKGSEQGNVFQCVPINLFRLVCRDLFTLCDRSSLSPMCSNIVQLWLNLGAIMPEPSQLSPGRSYMYGVLSASINRDFRNTFIFTRFPPLYLNCLLAIYSETFYIILHFLRLGFVLCATAW